MPHTWRALLKRQDLLLQSSELEHTLRVVLHQKPTQSVPAATHTHHHVFTMKHSDEDGLVSESVSTFREVLDGHSVGAVTGRFIQTGLLLLEQSSMLTAHTEGLDSGRRLLSQKQRLFQLDLLLQLHQHRRLHPVL